MSRKSHVLYKFFFFSLQHHVQHLYFTTGPCTAQVCLLIAGPVLHFLNFTSWPILNKLWNFATWLCTVQFLMFHYKTMYCRSCFIFIQGCVLHNFSIFHYRAEYCTSYFIALHGPVLHKLFHCITWPCTSQSRISHYWAMRCTTSCILLKGYVLLHFFYFITGTCPTQDLVFYYRVLYCTVFLKSHYMVAYCTTSYILLQSCVLNKLFLFTNGPCTAQVSIVHYRAVYCTSSYISLQGFHSSTGTLS